MIFLAGLLYHIFFLKGLHPPFPSAQRKDQTMALEKETSPASLLDKMEKKKVFHLSSKVCASRSYQFFFL